MSRIITYSLMIIAMLAVLISGNAAAHGHPAAIDPQHPDAWKYRLCSEMATVALQALHDRDKGRPMKVHVDEGGTGSRIAIALIQKIYAEPAISSPKRAEAFGRAFCNEQLQNGS
jgi:hypothetical protein